MNIRQNREDTSLLVRDDDDFIPTSFNDPEMTRLFSRNGIHLLFGDINKLTTTRTVEFIISANLKNSYLKSLSKKNREAINVDPLEYITLVINSDGGELYDAFAIISAIRGSVLPVRTVGMGSVSSSGLMIFIAGQKGNRLLTPNSTVLSHQWSTYTVPGSKEHELMAIQKDWRQTTTRMIKHYRECTGLSTKAIRMHLLPPQDVWLDPYESKKFKLCDKVGLWNLK